MKNRKWIGLLWTAVLLLLFLTPVTIRAGTSAGKKKVYVSGDTVGIYIRTKGLLVLGTQEVPESGEKKNPSLHRLLPGDYIVKANGQELNSKKDLLTFIKNNKDQEIIFTIIRKGEKQKIRIRPAYCAKSDSWQIGAWIRSDTQGIGTITCISPDGSFVALGHGISDYDLGVSMNIDRGSIYRAHISSLVRGEVRKPGEIVGSIHYSSENYLGKITANSPRGIVGTATEDSGLCDGKDLVEVADFSEIKKGKAFIRSSISGQSKDYAIEIEKMNNGRKDRQKTLKIHVTDPDLLALTGGIIQGLSGSPILQEGKLIGAVTHVLVRDPSRGYGIAAQDLYIDQHRYDHG